MTFRPSLRHVYWMGTRPQKQLLVTWLGITCGTPWELDALGSIGDLVRLEFFGFRLGVMVLHSEISSKLSRDSLDDPLFEPWPFSIFFFSFIIFPIRSCITSISSISATRTIIDSTCLNKNIRGMARLIMSFMVRLRCCWISSLLHMRRQAGMV